MLFHYKIEIGTKDSFCRMTSVIKILSYVLLNRYLHNWRQLKYELNDFIV